LIRLFSFDPPPPIEAVWTPETPGLVAPERVPLVMRAFLAGQVAAARAESRLAATNALLLGVLAFGAVRVDPWLPLALAVTAAAVVAVPAWVRVARARRDPPRALARALQDAARGARLAGAIATRPSPRWSYGLAGVLVAVYVGQLLRGLDGSILAAGLVKANARDGEPWRLLTGALLHGPPVHLLFNVMALVNLGSDVETFGGRPRMATVFLASALAGSVASLFLGPEGISVGASGGICGFLGWLAVLGWRCRDALPRRFGRAIAMNVVFLAAIGTLGARMIDNAGHAGGFVAGAVLGLAAIRRGAALPIVPGSGARLAGALSALVVFLGALLAMVAILAPERLPF
jgi:membrane associated rhomboid family serine protease